MKFSATWSINLMWILHGSIVLGSHYGHDLIEVKIYLCNLSLSPLKKLVWLPSMLIWGDKVWQWFWTGWWFSMVSIVTNDNITEILLK
jgi:hypothetical protein